MSIKFLYFDLGNVLLFFNHRLAAERLAKLANVDAESVFETIFRGDVNARCDGGLLSGPEFCLWFRERYDCRASDEAIVAASSDSFRVNPPMKAITSQLRAAGWRLGILSNTCDMHYDFFASGRYTTIPDAFDAVVLSYKLRLMKPDAPIYLEAANTAGVAPEEVFYCDDVPANVDGAKAAGFDAVLFTSAAQYAADARSRGIGFNY